MGENSDTLIKDRHESHGYKWGGGNREQYEQTKKIEMEVVYNYNTRFIMTFQIAIWINAVVSETVQIILSYWG